MGKIVKLYSHGQVTVIDSDLIYIPLLVGRRYGASTEPTAMIILKQALDTVSEDKNENEETGVDV